MRVGVRPLVGTRVRPNHLTTARLAAGLGAAACFAIGDPAWNWIGAGVFVLAMALDRADGVLARLAGTGSRFGHVYDLIADGASNAATFIGIGIGVQRSGGALAEFALVLGIIAGFAVAFAEIMVMRMDALGIQSTAELGGVRGFDPDDAMILVPVAVVAGFGGWMLAAAAVGASAALVWFTWKAMQAPPARQ